MKQPAILALARFEVGQTSRSARVLQDPLFAQRNQPYPSHEQTDVEHRPRWSESRGSAPPIAPHRSESPGRAQLLCGYRSESPRPSFLAFGNPSIPATMHNTRGSSCSVTTLTLPVINNHPTSESTTAYVAQPPATSHQPPAPEAHSRLWAKPPSHYPPTPSHGERSSPHSSPRRAEPSLPPPRFVEFSLFPLDRFISGDDHLCDAVARMDFVWLPPEVEKNHADFAAIARVDGRRAIRHRDGVLGGQAAARADLRLVSRRQLDAQAGGHHPRRARLQHRALHGS